MKEEYSPIELIYSKKKMNPQLEELKKILDNSLSKDGFLNLKNDYPRCYQFLLEGLIECHNRAITMASESEQTYDSGDNVVVYKSAILKNLIQ